MIKVEFKNVGQGDSIFLSWSKENSEKFGIIDAHIYNGHNPILDEIKHQNIEEIEFIILSHFHFDHYSGIAQILKYCLEKGIIIRKLYHTFRSNYFALLDDQLHSVKIQRAIQEFWDTYEMSANSILDIDTISFNTLPIDLYNTVKLQWHAPGGKDYDKLTKSHVRYRNKKTKARPDFNEVATIISINNEQNAILFTSDATKKKLLEISGKISKLIHLVQVPHHGSILNHAPLFWEKLNKISNCPSLFSVGNEARDRLPNKEVVKYFDENGFSPCSTNFVYGISEYYSNSPSPAINKVKSILNTRSKCRPIISKINSIDPKFTGNQTFKINLV